MKKVNVRKLISCLCVCMVAVSACFSTKIMTFASYRDNKMQVMDCNKPTEVWDISDDGEYSLSGHTNGLPLYTKYKFTGVKKYKIKIKNTGKDKVTVYTVKTVSKKQETIEPGKSKTFSYEPGKKSNKFYLKFDGKSVSVSGTVKEY